tara:strand:+ start:341 stop:838 length:498 start_codon:yes stop_codon:yes gene_type:complete
MAKMKCRLIIETTEVRQRVVNILKNTLGETEVYGLVKTDCVHYIINRMFESGWVVKSIPTRKVGNSTEKISYSKTGLVDRAGMKYILSQYMHSQQSIEEGDVEVDAVDYEHYQMIYELAAAALAADSELGDMIKCALTPITSNSAEHYFHAYDGELWLLDYIVRT